MKLVSCVTPDYIPKAGEYLGSIPLIRSVPLTVVLVGWGEGNRVLEGKLRECLPATTFAHLPLPELHSWKMVQYGAFLDALGPVSEDEVVVLTDCDIRVQRDFYEEELELLEGLGDNQWAAGWNAREGDTLAEEARRIGLPDSWNGGWEKWGHLPCMNCGVIAARVGVWKRVRAEYERLCPEFYGVCGHRSRIQFLLNYVFWKVTEGGPILPPQIHLQGHFLTPRGTPAHCPEARREGTIWLVGDEPVVFAHRL